MALIIEGLPVLKSVHFKKTIVRISFLSKFWYVLFYLYWKHHNFERNENCATVFLKWMDFTIFKKKIAHENMKKPTLKSCSQLAQTPFLCTGLAAHTAQKQKSRTTKSPLRQDWVFRLGGNQSVGYQTFACLRKFCISRFLYITDSRSVSQLFLVWFTSFFTRRSVCQILHNLPKIMPLSPISNAIAIRGCGKQPSVAFRTPG